uniref:Sodium channel modifier 1 n=1 Tax=Neolamprologus brichardi TaxID=32507 RepID=A0A3Q4HD11_NEOBR
MSFKREGNDKSQLNLLKKRRVADLLSNFIPEDEAALMKNGRYTCLVCSYRPVFDTVDMLAVHRKGKRHLDGLKAFYGKKARLKTEITKRQHENYVQAEEKRQEPSSSAPLLAQTRKLTHHVLLKTVPYNSCLLEKMFYCQPLFLANLGHDFASTPFVANNEPHPSKDTAECQAAERQEAEPITAQRKRELEHYLKLKSDGWLQDHSGKWVKDENVEFDSDEEEPLSLAPAPANK